MISREHLESLRQDWMRLLDRFGVPAAVANPPFDALAAAYAAPERHYHNLEHVREMLGVVSRLEAQADDPAAVRLAVWFHDAVYDPRAKDNEARSAELATAMLGALGVPAATVKHVANLVRSTAHLAAAEPTADRDAAVLLDADLAILGADEERYRRYAADVRKEYAFVPDTDYRTGRAAVLRAFLARQRIFQTPLLFAVCEGRARANLAAELKELSA